jgi:hypothetical protein
MGGAAKGRVGSGVRVWSAGSYRLSVLVKTPF